MRIRKERLESNVRVSGLEVKVAFAICDAIDEMDGLLTHLEIIDALQNVQTKWLRDARKGECPSLEEE